jgi:hypothetical protein
LDVAAVRRSGDGSAGEGEGGSDDGELHFDWVFLSWVTFGSFGKAVLRVRCASKGGLERFFERTR